MFRLVVLSCLIYVSNSFHVNMYTCKYCLHVYMFTCMCVQHIYMFIHVYNRLTCTCTCTWHCIHVYTSNCCFFKLLEMRFLTHYILLTYFPKLLRLRFLTQYIHHFQHSNRIRTGVFGYITIIIIIYRISSKNSAPLIFRHPLTQICKITSNFGRQLK